MLRYFRLILILSAGFCLLFPFLSGQAGTGQSAWAQSSPLDSSSPLPGASALESPTNSVADIDSEPDQHIQFLEVIIEIMGIGGILVLLALVFLHYRQKILARSEERLRTIFNAIHDAVFLHDGEGEIIFVNDKMLEMFKVSAKEALRYSILEDYSAPGNPVSTLPGIWQDVVAGHSHLFDWHAKRPHDGTTFDVEVFLRRIDLENRHLVLATVRDISARKKAEEELKTAHQQLLDIIEFLPDATFVIDRDRRIVAWNRALEEMTGVKKEQVIGKGDFAYGEPLYGIRRAVLIDLVDGFPEAGELGYDYVKKQNDTLYAERFLPALYGGRGAHVWVKASPLYDRSGNFAGAVESIRDITERKAAEDRLKQAFQELDSFVYTVSHDLRSPLTPIIGFAQVLKENYAECLDEQGLDIAQEIEKQGKRLLHLLEDLLVLSRVGRLTVPDEAVNCNEVLDEVLLGMGETMTALGADVRVSDLPTVHIPYTLLTQLFANLVGNALNYGWVPGTCIEVSGSRQGDFVQFYVRDHGAGIPPAERDRIFEVFFRGSTGREQKGTGIGLAIVQKIARLFHGRCWVDETPGGGCTVCIELRDAVPPEQKPF